MSSSEFIEESKTHYSINPIIKKLAEKIVEVTRSEDSDYDAIDKVHDILASEMFKTAVNIDVIKWHLQDIIESRYKTKILNDEEFDNL